MCVKAKQDKTTDISTLGTETLCAA